MFNIGDTVYYAAAGNKRIDIPCPICFGKRQVTLILGNGDSVELPCQYCGNGFDTPRGYIEEYEYIAEASPFLITGISINTTESGEKREYRSGSDNCYHNLHEDKCFATIEEALQAAISVKETMENEQKTRTEYIKKDKQKSFAWNAGYHMREAKRNRKDAEYHEEKAILCKAKDKMLSKQKEGE